MTLKQILTFTSKEEKRLSRLYGTGSEAQSIFAQTVKLSEELGELCNEVLARYGLQRSEKLNGDNHEDLEKEFADVVITALILAHSLELDVEKVLEKRIEQIKARQQNSKSVA